MNLIGSVEQVPVNENITGAVIAVETDTCGIWLYVEHDDAFMSFSVCLDDKTAKGVANLLLTAVNENDAAAD